VTAEDSLESQPREPGRRVNWRLRGSIAAVFLIAGLLVLAWPYLGDRESVHEHALRIGKENGIRIGYGMPEDFWVPPYIARDAAIPTVKMRPAPLHDVDIALNGIEVALREYPPGFVAGLIKAIFICGELRMDDVEAGGTTGPAWIILSAPSDVGDEGIRIGNLLGVHHELSSFVLRANPQTWEQWSKFAPAGWGFVDDARRALGRANGAAPSPETGFLSAYGATNLENDFNIYAERMFSEPGEVARLAREYPLVRRKLDFVPATYVAIDPRFADRFRQLGLERNDAK
jgi:hypothetical protein